MEKFTLFFALFTLAIYIYLGPSSPRFPKGIDPRIKPYVEKFEREGRRQLGSCYKVPPLNIGVGDTRFIDPFSQGDLRVVGLCNYVTGDMIIDEWLFDLNSTAIEEVVFHELGHCILRRPHMEQTLDGRIPLSLMHPIMVDERLYSKNRGYYITELFSTEPLCK